MSASQPAGSALQSPSSGRPRRRTRSFPACGTGPLAPTLLASLPPLHARRWAVLSGSRRQNRVAPFIVGDDLGSLFRDLPGDFRPALRLGELAREPPKSHGLSQHLRTVLLPVGVRAEHAAEGLHVALGPDVDRALRDAHRPKAAAGRKRGIHDQRLDGRVPVLSHASTLSKRTLVQFVSEGKKAAQLSTGAGEMQTFSKA